MSAAGARPGQDRVLIAISSDGLLRARAASFTHVVGDILQRQETNTLAGHALARAVGATALYPVSFKDVDRLAIQWSGGGPLRSLMVELRAAGPQAATIRALARDPAPKVWGEASSTANARPSIGRGLLPGGTCSVLGQQGSGHFTQGQVALTNGEVDEDLDAYFAQSEQQRTAVRVVVEERVDGSIGAVAGCLVQELPEAPKERFSRVDLARIGAGNTAEETLGQALGDDYRVVGSFDLQVACPCSRERARNGIAMLEIPELLEMLDEDHGATVGCDFCRTRYAFDEQDLLAIVIEKRTAET